MFLVDGLCPFPGGAERALLNTIRLLPKEKYRCSLALLSSLDPINSYNDLPCPLYEFPLRRSYDWNAMKMAARLRRFIRTERVSLVHTFFETSDLWGGLVAKLSGCPVLVSSRRDMGIMRSAKHQLAYRLMNAWVDLVISVSEEVRKFCIRQDGLKPSRVVTLYNGVELERIDAANETEGLRASFGLERASHLVITVANIRQVKGIDTFICAARIVRREFPNVLFGIIGFPEEKEHLEELEELTRSLGLTRHVQFLGATEKVFSLLKLSDVFCLLSRSEGFSNALLEAMACGLPCVATRAGGNCEVLEDNQTGFLVPPEDAAAAADRISLLLRERELAQRMGAAARQAVKARFTMQAMAEQLANLYESLLSGKRS
jgi:glycosyltransferase involved in cell wall biosynthesis